MPFDLSLKMAALVVLGALSVLAALAIALSGRCEELDAAIDTLLPEPAEDALPLSPSDVDAEFERITAAYGEWPKVPRLRRPGDPYDVETDGL